MAIKTVLGKLVNLNKIQLENNSTIRAIPFNFHQASSILNRDAYFQLQELTGGYLILNILVIENT